MNRLTTGLWLYALFITGGRAQTLLDLRTQSKSVDFSAAQSTKPMQTGSSLPGTCAVGQFFFLTSAPAGSNVYACNPANAWVTEGTGITVTSGTTNDVLSNNGSSIQWLPLGGDISGTPSGLTVGRLQGRPVSSTAPSNGQVLQWNASANQWQPAAGSGGVATVFGRSGAITAQTGDYSFGQISGIVGSSQLPSAGGDVGGALTSATVTGIQNRTVANTAPANGQTLVWNSATSSWAPATVSGAVSTVFGRSGSITAQAGDYSFGQISGIIGSNQFPGAGGDLSGTLTAATVAGIQSRAVSNIAPANGQALVWNAGTSVWAPATISGSGGASMTNQLGDLAAVRSSSTVLSIAAGCTPSSPCNVRFGYQVYSITNSATATISGGSGTAYIYLNSAGTLIVGHNLTVACSAGCTQQGGVTSFPPNVLPIFSWTASSGTWDSTGGRDQRAFLSTKTLAGGQGIVVTEAPGQSTLAVDNGVIPTYLTNTASLSFSSIPTGACAADQSITVAGANPGDAVAPAWPALPTGVFGTMLISATNTVTVRLCNLSGLAVALPSSAYRATIVRNY